MGDFQPLLFKTIDFGKNWTKITNGIDKEHFTRVVREDPKQKDLLYAGTETGMYISFNDGANWEPFQLNLPIVPITDLTIKENSLIVATQGRSLWILDDLTVLHQLEKSMKSPEMILFQPKASYRTKGTVSKTPSLIAGENHPNGVVTHFYLKDLNKKDTIALTYLTKTGDTLARFMNYSEKKERKLEVKEGGNTHVWDTRGKGAEELEGMILWSANLNGAKAVPGSYQVTLNVNGEQMKQAFTILPDPRAEVSVEEMQEQYDFIEEINSTVDKAHQSIKRIRKINSQLDAFTKQYGDNPKTKELVKKANEMKEGFEEIEKALYQTQNRSPQDPLNFPIRLNNKLAHLNNLVSKDDFPPTQQDIAVKEELTTEVNKQLASFDAMLDKEVDEFNKDFNTLNLNYLFIEQ
jgi:hypothetical protein